MNKMMSHEDLGAMSRLGPESQDEPGTVNIVIYRGTVYGVYARYEDAREFAMFRFGENAVLYLDATILRQKVQ